jgi:hypothetical protein
MFNLRAIPLRSSRANLFFCISLLGAFVAGAQPAFAAPSVSVTKSAGPPSRPAPGGSFTFSVIITNTSNASETLLTLVDDVYGNLNGRGSCATTGTLAASGGTYACSFSGNFTGNPGDSQTDTVTATVVSSSPAGAVASGSASATVTLTAAIPPSVSVTKDASPTLLPSGGGTVTFSLSITNTSAAPESLSSLVDNIYGNLIGRLGSTCATGVTLAKSGGTYLCTFTGNFVAADGASQTDTVTATVTGSLGLQASGSASATVRIAATPSITVSKTPNPSSLPEPGGTFNFSVVVTNTSPAPATLTSLSDDKYGDLFLASGTTCASGAPIAASGGTYSCSFNADFFGVNTASQTDIVTATVTGDFAATASNTGQATVSIGPPIPPSITVTKTPNPSSRPEPGGSFDFTVVVTNTSAAPATLTTLTDDIYGDLNGLGTCSTGTVIPAFGGTYSCVFSGLFNNTSGQSQTDIVTAMVTGTVAQTASNTGQATVTITPPPSATVTKTPSPASLPAPGGTFNFTVLVTSTSGASETITGLVDDKYGDLNGQGTCVTGATLAVSSATYSCSFDGIFTGLPTDSQTDTVTATVTGTLGVTATATGQATVSLTAPIPPGVTVTKTPSPASLPAPGGSFNFAIVVTNTSAAPATLTGLTDDVYGDLNGQGTCTTGAFLIASGGTYSCSFNGNFTGLPSDTQTDIVTATVTGTLAQTATGTAPATVSLTAAIPPGASVTKSVSPISLPVPGGNFTFTVAVTNTTTAPETLTTLVDSVYGDLNAQGDCLTGGVISPGGTYSCTFNKSFTGNVGDQETDTVTATVTGSLAATTTGTGAATVSITPPTAVIPTLDSSILALLALMLAALGILISRRR